MGGQVKGTDTIHFIGKGKVPHNRKKEVSYGSFICNLKTNKEEKECTRLTLEEDCINYSENVRTPTADMIFFKCLTNSMISTPGAQCIILDIKDFYFNTPMKRYEYMRLKLTDIPDKIIKEYNLQELVTPDGYMTARSEKACMAYLRQAS